MTGSRAMRRAAAGLALTAVAAASLAATATSAAGPGACASPVRQVTGLNATGRVSCGTARAVSSAYDAAVMNGEHFPGGKRVRAARFSCATTPVGHSSEETFFVRCAGRGGLVRFAWGV